MTSMRTRVLAVRAALLEEKRLQVRLVNARPTLRSLRVLEHVRDCSRCARASRPSEVAIEGCERHGGQEHLYWLLYAYSNPDLCLWIDAYSSDYDPVEADLLLSAAFEDSHRPVVFKVSFKSSVVLCLWDGHGWFLIDPYGASEVSAIASELGVPLLSVESKYSDQLWLEVAILSLDECLSVCVPDVRQWWRDFSKKLLRESPEDLIEEHRARVKRAKRAIPHRVNPRNVPRRVWQKRGRSGRVMLQMSVRTARTWSGIANEHGLTLSEIKHMNPSARAAPPVKGGVITVGSVREGIVPRTAIKRTDESVDDVVSMYHADSTFPLRVGCVVVFSPGVVDPSVVTVATAEARLLNPSEGMVSRIADATRRVDLRVMRDLKSMGTARVRVEGSDLLRVVDKPHRTLSDVAAEHGFTKEEIMELNQGRGLRIDDVISRYRTVRIGCFGEAPLLPRTCVSRLGDTIASLRELYAAKRVVISGEFRSNMKVSLEYSKYS